MKHFEKNLNIFDVGNRVWLPKSWNYAHQEKWFFNFKKKTKQLS